MLDFSGYVRAFQQQKGRYMQIGERAFMDIIEAPSINYADPTRYRGIRRITNLNGIMEIGMLTQGEGFMQPPVKNCNRKALGNIGMESKTVMPCYASWFMELCEHIFNDKCTYHFDYSSKNLNRTEQGRRTIIAMRTVVAKMFYNTLNQIHFWGDVNMKADAFDFVENVDNATLTNRLVSFRRCNGLMALLNECTKPYTIPVDADGNVAPADTVKVLEELHEGNFTSLELMSVNKDTNAAFHVSGSFYRAYCKYLRSQDNDDSFTFMIKGVPTECKAYNGIPLIAHEEWDMQQSKMFCRKQQWAMLIADGGVCMGTNVGPGGNGVIEVKYETDIKKEGMIYFDGGKNICMSTDIISNSYIRAACSEPFKIINKNNC